MTAENKERVWKVINTILQYEQGLLTESELNTRLDKLSVRNGYDYILQTRVIY